MVTSPRTRERGFTVLEVTIALGIVTVLLTAALGGVRAHQVSAAQAFSRLAALRAAASRLEELRDDAEPLAAGRWRFTPVMAGAEGEQQVVEVEPGLYEVVVEVHHPDERVRARLTTLVVREASP